MANVDLDYVIGHGLGAHLKFVWVANQYYYARRGPALKAKLGDATRLDLRLRWQPRDNWPQFYTGVDNVLDEDYEFEYGTPAPGRFLYAGLQWTFD